MKRLAFILALLCPFLSITAQESSFYFGANGGFNASKFKFTEDLSELYTTSNPLVGLNGGLDVGFIIQNVSLSTGLHYVQKGSEYQTDNFVDETGTGFYSATERLHFLSVPVLVGYRLYLGDRVGVAVALGPSFNIGLSGKIDDRIEYFGTDDTVEENFQVAFGSGVNEDYKGVDVGFQISPGIFYEVNDKSRLMFRVTWDTSTSDTFNPRYKDANEFFEFNQGNQTNHSTMFTIGYEYHFTFSDKY